MLLGGARHTPKCRAATSPAKERVLLAKLDASGRATCAAEVSRRAALSRDIAAARALTAFTEQEVYAGTRWNPFAGPPWALDSVKARRLPSSAPFCK